MSRRRREFECESLRLLHFVNRESQRALVQELVLLPPGSALPVLLFRGVGGMGKSSLLDRIRHEICLPASESGTARGRPPVVPHAWVDFSSAASAHEGGVREASGLLHGVKQALAHHKMRFPRFELVWARYRELLTGQEFEPARASRTEFGTLLDVVEQVGGSVGSAVGLAKVLTEQGVRWYRDWSDGKLGPDGMSEWYQAEEAAVALEPALAADILAEVSKAPDRHGCRWPLLFFDSLEWLDPDGEQDARAFEAAISLSAHLPRVPVLLGSRVTPKGIEALLEGRELREIEVGARRVQDPPARRRGHRAAQQASGPGDPGTLRPAAGSFRHPGADA